MATKTTPKQIKTKEDLESMAIDDVIEFVSHPEQPNLRVAICGLDLKITGDRFVFYMRGRVDENTLYVLYASRQELNATPAGRIEYKGDYKNLEVIDPAEDKELYLDANEILRGNGY